jgi:hypothetical protein
MHKTGLSTIVVSGGFGTSVSGSTVEVIDVGRQHQ